MIKNLSNPYSTGGGGFNFEAHVQASFVVLMLTDGISPCLPNYSIQKIDIITKEQNFFLNHSVISGLPEDFLKYKNSIFITSKA